MVTKYSGDFYCILLGNIERNPKKVGWECGSLFFISQKFDAITFALLITAKLHPFTAQLTMIANSNVKFHVISD